jgi:adenosine deaminase
MRWISATILAVALAASAPSSALAQTPDFSRMTHGELEAMLRVMPKGGDLHLHLSGAPYAEDFIGWAIEDGACVEAAAMRIVRCAAGMVPAADFFRNLENRSAMIDALSTRRVVERSGHDQFFGAFARQGDMRRRRGDMVAGVMRDLAAQNTFYVEIMFLPQADALRALAPPDAVWSGDLAVARTALAPALPAIVAAARQETDDVMARARTLAGCAAATPPPACAVEVRFLVQPSRTVALNLTFAQLEFGAALIDADDRWVGLQLVSAEDNPFSLANYSEHMRMIGYSAAGRIPVALHAGELTLDYATPPDMRFHITEAIRIAGARRIGHGVSITHENNSFALVREMAANNIMVEVNLTSNDIILDVSGPAHPYAWLRERGVPTALSTDDPGVSRSDLTGEYVRAVTETGATYRDLVASGRNALAFSFLPGQGLWDDPGVYTRPAQPCRRELGAAQPSPTCQAFLDQTPKARAQFEHEARLSAFEQAFAIRR